jgi:cohesin complex subunit SA-1/2
VSAWVDAYQAATGDEEAEKTAVHELVVFFIRACGLGADVEDPEALDQDGVADVIERIQDESVRVS